MGTRLRLTLAAIAFLLLTLALARLGAPGMTAGRRAPVPPAPPPPLSPEDALLSFQLEPGLRLQLAASEPMVEAPVAASFDEDGRLWVVEMRTYMPDAEAQGELEPGNRIIILEDIDGDGVMDRRSVFLDGLVLPRAVAPCYGGALVLEPPKLFFCRDTDGDGRADEKREVLSGFEGRENPEHAGNGLMYGLDNWYALSQHRVRLRFDGERIRTEPVPAHGQWGIAQDDYGRLYYTPNSDPLLADIYPKQYAARNRGMPNAPGIGEPIFDSREVWPLHPTPGVNRGYMEGILRGDKRLAVFTAACGQSIYQASVLGEEYRGNAFICEPAGNLVKRFLIRELNDMPRATNAAFEREFLASTDERFRPVNSLIGPDGALYLLDMYRGVIQHKTYITPYLREQITSRALERPLNHGRIYRITREGHASEPRPKLSMASNGELAALLSHPDGWWRRTAQRLLVERRATDIADQIRATASNETTTVARLHGLWTLEGLGELRYGDVLAAMADPDPHVRAAGIRLSELFPDDDAIRGSLAVCTSDPNRAVQIQAACTLGQRSDAKALELLASLSRTDPGDAYLRSAIVSGVGGREVTMLRLLLADPTWPTEPGARAFANALADSSLRQPRPASRTLLAELAAELVAANDSRAGLLFGRWRAHMRLDTKEPRVVSVEREPAGLLAAASGKSETAAELLDIAAFLDWPGRGPVVRQRRPRPLSPVEQARFEAGRIAYQGCIACHQEGGHGSPGMAPSLIGTPRVLGDEGALARILLHGMEGPYTIEGNEFEGFMPAVLEATDEDLAAVMTFIRRSWGNTADPVPPEAVAKARRESAGRTEPWTAKELGEIGK